MRAAVRFLAWAGWVTLWALVLVWGVEVMR